MQTELKKKRGKEERERATYVEDLAQLLLLLLGGLEESTLEICGQAVAEDRLDEEAHSLEVNPRGERLAEIRLAPLHKPAPLLLEVGLHLLFGFAQRAKSDAQRVMLSRCVQLCGKSQLYEGRMATIISQR